MKDNRPGLNPARLVRLMRAAVSRCQLDLRDTVVFTEAATGAYAVTPILAALGGADHVFALTRDSQYGSVAEVRAETESLAARAGVAGQIEVVTEKCAETIGLADVVTNCGHVRPIDQQTVRWMRPNAVVPLMYESWELRPGEVDINACRTHGVRVAGTNERHPRVDVFSYLGAMAVQLLAEAGVAAYRGRIIVVCDNPFAPFLRGGLDAAGAKVTLTPVLSPLALKPSDECDAVLVATGSHAPVMGSSVAAMIAAVAPSTVVVQFWGDIDRAAFDAAGIAYWPPAPPQPGHMAILPSALGPEPIVRLQAGGLKVAEILLDENVGSDDWRYLDPI